jgi:VIT1/CCC1 family predicted Fe2+/Mn2+ transporter
MVYYVEIYDFELNPDSSMSSEEVKEYAESANIETVRHYSFTDLRKAKLSFEIAKEAAVAEKNEDNNYEVRGIKLIEAESVDESEFQMTIDSYYPAIDI